MKRKMTRLTLDGLSDEERKDYLPAKIAVEGKEVDGFALDVEGLEDHPELGNLRRAKEREKIRATEAEAKAKSVEKVLEEEKEKALERMRGHVPKSDLESIETSWRGKLTKAEGERDTLQKGLNKHLITNVARDIATEIAVDKDAIPGLLPHILPRLAVEMQGEDAVTRILGADGKPTATSIEDFKKELLAAKPLARLVSGTKGTGGGSHGAEGARGGAPTQIDLSKSNKEIAAQLELQDPSLATG
jgi:hypothetical protein